MLVHKYKKKAAPGTPCCLLYNGIYISLYQLILSFRIRIP